MGRHNLKDQLFAFLKSRQDVALHQLLMHLLEHRRGVSADPAMAPQRLLRQTQLCLQISARRQPQGTLINRLTDLLALWRHIGSVIIVQSDLSRA